MMNTGDQIMKKRSWTGLLSLAVLIVSLQTDAQSSATQYTVSSASIDQVVEPDRTQVQKKRTNEPAKCGDNNEVRVNIWTGSEKIAWLEKMRVRWEQSQKNTINRKVIKIVNTSVGSVSGATAVANGMVDGQGCGNIQVWSPASTAYQSWVTDAYSDRVLMTNDPLVRTPMVFAMLEGTQKGIETKTQRPMSFNTIAQVLDQEYDQKYSVNNVTGNFAFSDRVNPLRFGITMPGESNSGVTALISMAYEYFAENRERGLRPIRGIINIEHLKNAQFQGYLSFMKGQVNTRFNSTADLAREFGAEGSTLDGVFIYENTALEQIDNLALRRSQKKIVLKYPTYNVWNDNPYYIVRNGSTIEQQDAARLFLAFLLERDQQLAAMEDGFRPASSAVTNEEVEKRFAPYKSKGFVLDVDSVSKTVNNQSGDVIRGLLHVFTRVKALN